MSDIVLIGPQHHRHSLKEVLQRLGVDGPVATVTCGWQEGEEEEADAIQAQLDQPVLKLLLHRRSDDIFHRDPEFFDAYRERQNDLYQLQEVYRLRLDLALLAARKLIQREGRADVLDPEREEAIEAVRRLDAHHLSRLEEVHRRFEEKWPAAEREIATRHREELMEELGEASAVAVSGGHVAVLLYRFQLFDLLPAIEHLPVIAWSAGAMVFSEQIVLFHDNPPQGQGNAEVLEAGMGRVRGLLPFPDARRRLRLDDPMRVGILARRFAPRACVAMEGGDQLHYRNEVIDVWEGTRQLATSGQLIRFTP